jgi:hypothetical protein
MRATVENTVSAVCTGSAHAAPAEISTHILRRAHQALSRLSKTRVWSRPPLGRGEPECDHARTRGDRYRADPYWRRGKRRRCRQEATHPISWRMTIAISLTTGRDGRARKCVHRNDALLLLLQAECSHALSARWVGVTPNYKADSHVPRRKHTDSSHRVVSFLASWQG